jgi:steroid delta-isomerase-like uncharacterized protein
MKTSTVLTLAAVLGLAAVSACSAPLSEKKQAAIRQELTQVMQDYTAACEHVDCAAAMKFAADVPEFRYADIDGKQYDYAGFNKVSTDFFAGFSAMKATTRNQEILVLGADTAFVIWHGACDLIQKDGTVLRSDPYNITCLFKRFDGTWKFVFSQESGVPFQPGPPQAAKPAPAPSVGVLTSPQAANEAVVREFFAAIDRNDFGKLKELSADDFSFMAPGLAKPLKLEDLFQVVKNHYASFPDWKHQVADMMAEGDKVAVRLLETGTHTVAYEGIPATNAKVTMPALCSVVCANGKVREMWAVEDYWDFYQQLGMELKPRALKEDAAPATPPSGPAH